MFFFIAQFMTTISLGLSSNAETAANPLNEFSDPSICVFVCLFRLTPHMHRHVMWTQQFFSLFRIFHPTRCVHIFQMRVCPTRQSCQLSTLIPRISSTFLRHSLLLIQFSLIGSAHKHRTIVSHRIERANSTQKKKFSFVELNKLVKPVDIFIDFHKKHSVLSEQRVRWNLSPHLNWPVLNCLISKHQFFFILSRNPRRLRERERARSTLKTMEIRRRPNWN